MSQSTHDNYNNANMLTACIDSSRHFVFLVARKSRPVHIRNLMRREGKRSGEAGQDSRWDSGAGICLTAESSRARLLLIDLSQCLSLGHSRTSIDSCLLLRSAILVSELLQVSVLILPGLAPVKIGQLQINGFLTGVSIFWCWIGPSGLRFVLILPRPYNCQYIVIDSRLLISSALLVKASLAFWFTPIVCCVLLWLLHSRSVIRVYILVAFKK